MSRDTLGPVFDVVIPFSPRGPGVDDKTMDLRVFWEVCVSLKSQTRVRERRESKDDSELTQEESTLWRLAESTEEPHLIFSMSTVGSFTLGHRSTVG